MSSGTPTGESENLGRSEGVEGNAVRILRHPSVIKKQFDGAESEADGLGPGPREECCDGLGYDVRLGKSIYMLQRSEHKLLGAGDRFCVYPGETLVATTLETLKLDVNVFATGSPKMSLLMKGLWAHGGKTDFGFKGELLLGFKNEGNQEVVLEYGMRVFHLTFWEVDRDDNITDVGVHSGRRPQVERSTGDDPLTSLGTHNDRRRARILRQDGILAYRLMNQLDGLLFGHRLWLWTLTFGLATLSIASIAKWLDPNQALWTPSIGFLIGGITLLITTGWAFRGVQYMGKRFRGEALKEEPWVGQSACEGTPDGPERGPTCNCRHSAGNQKP